MRSIGNEMLKVSIDEMGAELCSIIRKDDGTEYVWQADPSIWKRHAPLLFPIVGRLKDKEYTLDGKTWSITQHGFGRDMVFKARPVSTRCIEFVLTDNEYTHSMYPYAFQLIVRYSLDGNTLKKEHIVENRSDVPMYYEVGGHDAYALCLTPGEKITDSYVEFEGMTEIRPIITDENVFLSRDHRTIPLKDGRLYLDRHTFDQDAMMLDEVAVRRVTLGSERSEKKVVMDFADFPYFAIWSKYMPDRDVPYVCLEPWSTLPDGSYLGKALEEKIGVRCIAPGESENLSFSVSIF